MASSSIVASPAYLQRHGTPQAPQDLAAHTTLSFSEPQSEVRWPLRNRQDEALQVALRPQLFCNDFIVLTDAAVLGRGIALLPQSEGTRVGKGCGGSWRARRSA